MTISRSQSGETDEEPGRGRLPGFEPDLPLPDLHGRLGTPRRPGGRAGPGGRPFPWGGRRLLLARGLLFALLLPVRGHPLRDLCSLFRSPRTARSRRLLLARRSLRSLRAFPRGRLPPPASSARRSRRRTTARRVDRLLQGVDIFPQLVQERRYLRLPGGHAVGDGLTDPLGELIHAWQRTGAHLQCQTCRPTRCRRPSTCP